MASSGVGYDDRIADLAGTTVILDAELHRGPDNQLQLGAGDAGCALSQPQPTVALPDPSISLGLVVAGTRVRLFGVLEYGFQVDESGTATYLRLRGARPC
ncbi:MAG: hypothetical protein M3450_02120 [Actinomycetota bacterium]|nr:hypothetical protein [Actinomycetota bacterium]